MPQYERGRSGQEIGELQQRLAGLGYEVSTTYEFDEYTEEALRRYQVDWLSGEGTGVADEQTLTQLEYHHSSQTSTSVQYQESSEHYQPVDPPISPDGKHWWDGSKWNPFGDPQMTPLYSHTTDENGGEHYFAGFMDVDDPKTGTKITSFGGHVDVTDAGFHYDVEAAKVDLQTPSGVGVQLGAFTASEEVLLGEKGYYGVGSQANILEGGFSYGQRGRKKNEDGTDSHDDVFIKGGASYGVGAAGRVYAGTDADNDGVREYGLGADYAFLGGDIRVESETLTEAHQLAGEAYEEVKQEAGEMYDAAAETAGEVFDSVVDQAGKILSGEEPLPDVRN